MAPKELSHIKCFSLSHRVPLSSRVHQTTPRSLLTRVCLSSRQITSSTPAPPWRIPFPSDACSATCFQFLASRRSCTYLSWIPSTAGRCSRILVIVCFLTLVPPVPVPPFPQRHRLTAQGNPLFHVVSGLFSLVISFLPPLPFLVLDSFHIYCLALTDNVVWYSCPPCRHHVYVSARVYFRGCCDSWT